MLMLHAVASSATLARDESGVSQNPRTRWLCCRWLIGPITLQTSIFAGSTAFVTATDRSEGAPVSNCNTTSIERNVQHRGGMKISSSRQEGNL